MPATVKLIAALFYVIAVALAPRTRWDISAGAAVALLLAGLWTRAPWQTVFKRLCVAESFILGIALLSLFQPNGGLIFASMLVKSTLCLGCMILLSLSTPFSQLLGALRTLRVPALLVTTLALTHRYVFVLLEEMHRMQRARQCRTFTPKRWLLWHALSTVIAQLFVRSSERAERIYNAMQARGWKT